MNSYIDENETIYASEHIFVPSLVAGNNEQVWLGLADIPDLSGQSKVFINSVRCEWKGSASSGGAGESFG